MSDHVLKASIRQTLAYIEAYDADLLRAIEASFKEALHNCDDEDEDEEQSTVKEQASPAPPQKPCPAPQPAAHIPEQTKVVHTVSSATVELFELSAWHYRLPFITAIAITALLLALAR